MCAKYLKALRVTEGVTVSVSPDQTKQSPLPESTTNLPDDNCTALPPGPQCRRMAVMSSSRALRTARCGSSCWAPARAAPAPRGRWRAASRTCCSSTSPRWTTWSRLGPRRLHQLPWPRSVFGYNSFTCCLFLGGGWSGWNQQQGVQWAGAQVKRPVGCCWTLAPLFFSSRRGLLWSCCICCTYFGCGLASHLGWPPRLVPCAALFVVQLLPASPWMLSRISSWMVTKCYM